jgi:hypothetical protein
LGIEHTLLVISKEAMDSTRWPIKSARGYDDNIIAKESTEAEQYSEKNQG